jgi:hypothetical protein
MFGRYDAAGATIQVIRRSGLVERLVTFYAEPYSTVLPHSALKGRTPAEAFRGDAIDFPERLREAVAIQERIAVNRGLSCDDCPVATRAREGSEELQ